MRALMDAARIACVLTLAILCACATPPAPRPRVARVPPIVRAPQAPINYLKTLGGGWRIKLNDDHRALTKCQYGLTVGPARRLHKTLYLRVVFENPLSRSSPFITDTKIEPWMRELAIRSPEVRGLRKGARYLIRIHIFDHPERKKAIGFHDQWMPARLNVKADGSVSF